MTDFAVEAQLNVDGSPTDLGAAAMAWFQGWAQALVADEMGELADRPARLVRRPVQAGEVFGALTIVRDRESGPPRIIERTACDTGFDWFGGELTDPPRKAQIRVFRAAATGQTSRELNAEAEWPPQSPGWLRLQTSVGSGEFADPVTQRSWLEAFFTQADRWNPGFGQLGNYHDHATALEDSLDSRTHPREERDPQFTIGMSRQILRGYSWVTILPLNLVPTLDDPESLAKSGAFVDVRRLSSGGLWLRATDDIREYDETAARKVFDALARVLRRGMPLRKPVLPGRAPYLLAYEDAATYQDDTR